MSVKWDYDMVKDYIEVESNSGCQLISTEFKNTKTKLKLLCGCGDIFELTFGEFKYKNKMQCNKCSYAQNPWKNNGRMHMDLTGNRYGMLKVKGRDENKNHGIYWICKCECDNMVSYTTKELTRKSSPKVDCGCVRIMKLVCKVEECGGKHQSRGYCNKHYRQIMKWGELRPDLEIQLHGLSYTKIYRAYSAMKSRCYNPNDPNYIYYGSRGIKICDEWVGDFMQFYNWSIKNGHDDNLTIDRINNDGNYEPSNCRWTTTEEQNKNKSNVHLITHNNQTETLREWSKLSGINYDTMLDRYNKGYNPFIPIAEQK